MWSTSGAMKGVYEKSVKEYMKDLSCDCKKDHFELLLASPQKHHFGFWQKVPSSLSDQLLIIHNNPRCLKATLYCTGA